MVSAILKINESLWATDWLNANVWGAEGALLSIVNRIVELVHWLVMSHIVLFIQTYPVLRLPKESTALLELIPPENNGVLFNEWDILLVRVISGIQPNEGRNSIVRLSILYTIIMYLIKILNQEFI